MSNRRGLTIVELLVSLAIVATLLAILTPAALAMRERARETTCKNNVHQLDLAVAAYTNAHKRIPLPSPPEKVGGWMVELLPFLEQGNLKDRLPLGAPLAEASEEFYRPPSVYLCPRRTSLDGSHTANKAIVAAHYVLAPSSLESCTLSDSPLNVVVPWLAGPTMQYADILRSKGPHHGGFFIGNASQGVDFFLDGRRVY